MATLVAKRLYNVEELGPVQLRGLDALECNTGGMTPEQAIARSIKDSWESYSIWEGKRLIMVMGYMPQGFIGETVRAWCLTTPDVNDHKVWFSRASRRCVSILLDRYLAIEVYVWRGHTSAKKWLRWLGFKHSHIDGHFDIMRKER